MDWLWAGARSQASVTTRRKIMQVNLGAAGVALTILAYFAYYQWSGNPALVRTGWAQLPFVLGVPLVWRLNAQGRDQQARWLVFALAMGGTLAAVLAGIGTALGAHIYFLLFAVLTLAFFPLAQWRSALVLSLCNALIFLAFDQWGWPAHASLQALPAATQKSISQSLVVGCITVAIALTALSEWAADLNEQRLLALADTDALTGLRNRRALLEALQGEVARARRSGRPLSVAVLDLDHFKSVNDHHGHEAGDQVLRQFAELMRRELRGYDTGGRLGGEEFVVLMPDTDLALAVASIDRLRAALAARPLAWIDEQVDMTVSAGVACLSAEDEGDGSDLLRAADLALYAAKRDGRNRVRTAL
ncbi:GGDEF domain-containing protein [Ideonella alba]|uniref:diguanylate cyclase n=1 Tax=Ideonella alba TaxID=2824118 RepID=A0A940Y803_9BURK|nr:GGDEF domain-containing protein [Ideonella alba]MBQ0930523.1 GGDEF domain-containing protein [Ideonella alba]